MIDESRESRRQTRPERLHAHRRFRAYLFLQAVREVVDRARFRRMARRDMRRERPLPDTRSAGEGAIYGRWCRETSHGCFSA
ncbi:MAG: hypothetical protein ABIP94_09445 [Planctomycetota bacterium]